MPEPVHDAENPTKTHEEKMLNCHAQKCTGVFRLENSCGWQGKTKNKSNQGERLDNGAIVWFSSRTLEAAKLAQYLLPKTY